MITGMKQARLPTLTFFFILTLTVCSIGLQGQSTSPFSLQQVLSSPLPSSLVASSDGQRLAWVFNREGVRNIWVAEGPQFQARKLTAYSEDDGREISISGFSARGAKIIFARDGQFNADHEPKGAPGTRLLAVPWEGGEAVEIAETGRSVIAPDGERLAFIKDGAIHLASLEGSDEPEEAVKLRGDLSDLRWSPDSRKLAFRVSRSSTSEEYSYIAVYDLNQKKIKYLDPQIYQDRSPRWSPDGSRIAFLRGLENDRQFVLISREFPMPEPWQIVLYDLDSDRAQTVYESPKDDRLSGTGLWWADESTLFFTSEQDGWRHLYSIPAAGGKVSQLTEGKFEIEAVYARQDLARVFLTMNKDDIDRRHIWSVDASGHLRQETSGESIEWSPTVTGNGRFLAFLGSDAVSPAHVYVTELGSSGRTKLAPEALPGDFPEEHLVQPQQVIFEAEDGLKIHGQLFKPPDRMEGPHPAVMYFHGGPIRQMLLGWHYSGYYHRAYAMNQYLASQGYVVLAVNYRLGIGYGRDFRDVPDGGPRGASEYQDLLAGARYLRSLPAVDDERIGLWGGSYGGLMTALGLARNSDLFAAGVDLHGVHDWNQWQAWVVGREDDGNRTVWKSSPIADVDSWRSPVLLIHADDDRNVPFSETIWLAQKLKERGVEYELLVFPDDVHSFLKHENWLRAFKAAARFFDRHLKD